MAPAPLGASQAKTVQRKIFLILIAAAIVGTTGAAVWHFTNHNGTSADDLVLYGNVDIRQVQLAFNGSERIDRMQASEGQQVRKGQVLATLNTATLQQKVHKADADVEAARLAATNAAHTYRRTRALVAKHFVAQQQADDARTASDAAQAALQAAQAAQELANKALADAELVAPADGVIQDRILEPGDMASPQRPAYTLALTDPLWVRTYVQETDLGRLKPGMAAEVSTDSYPGKRYQAWIGYISPSAEFTPKSVETTEVRSSLVYQVRIFVCNPQGELRLGMPATVTVPLNQPPLPEASRCAHG
ncbi:MAG: efflux RND transporter periplasmic adaptor subunit [Sideroxydans sp.]|nr:efflux RND transporter periplasmic adaptor subunit [Sideroxydans sp.]